MGGRRVQEARHRPGELLAQRRAAGLPVPRPQRHPVPQRCAAAGAAGAGGHPGSPRTRSPARIAVLVCAGRRRCCRGRGIRCPARASTRRRSVRAERAVPGVARRRIVAAEPRRSAADTGRSDRRAAGRPATRRAGHTGAAAANAPPGRAPSPWGRPARCRRRRRSRPGCHPDPRRHRARRNQLPAPFMATRADLAVAVRREVARIEHRL